MERLLYGTVLRSGDDWMVVGSRIGLRPNQYRLRCSDGETRVLSTNKVHKLVMDGRVSVSVPQGVR